MSARQTVLTLYFRLDAKMKPSTIFLALLVASFLTMTCTYEFRSSSEFDRPTSYTRKEQQQDSDEAMNSLDLAKNLAKRRKNIRQILLRYPTLLDKFFPYFAHNVKQYK